MNIQQNNSENNVYCLKNNFIQTNSLVLDPEIDAVAFDMDGTLLILLEFL